MTVPVLVARLVGLVVLLVGSTVVLAGPAAAHGALVDGSPGPGDEVAPRTSVIRLDFASVGESGPAYVALRDAADRPVAVGAARVVGDRTVCARSSALVPGVHTLDYSVVSGDGHRLSGRYRFEVTSPARAADPGSCAGVDLARPGAAETLEEMTTPSTPTSFYYGLGALVVVSGGLVLWRVRRDRAAS